MGCSSQWFDLLTWNLWVVREEYVKTLDPLGLRATFTWGLAIFNGLRVDICANRESKAELALSPRRESQWTSQCSYDCQNSICAQPKFEWRSHMWSDKSTSQVGAQHYGFGHLCKPRQGQTTLADSRTRHAPWDVFRGIIRRAYYPHPNNALSIAHETAPIWNRYLARTLRQKINLTH